MQKNIKYVLEDDIGNLLFICHYAFKTKVQLNCYFSKRGKDLFIIFLRFFFFQEFLFSLDFLNDEFNFKTPSGCCGFYVVMHIFLFALLLLLTA